MGVNSCISVARKMFSASSDARDEVTHQKRPRHTRHMFRVIREGPRADKPSHGKPHTGGAPHRAGPKPSGERNWDGQKPPKFLKQRDGGRPTNRKPAA